MVAGIEYAVESGADVINLRLGIAGKVNFPSVKAALLHASAAGVEVVAAAGNLGDQTPYYLAGREGRRQRHGAGEQQRGSGDVREP